MGGGGRRWKLGDGRSKMEAGDSALVKDEGTGDGSWETEDRRWKAEGPANQGFISLAEISILTGKMAAPTGGRACI